MMSGVIRIRKDKYCMFSSTRQPWILTFMHVSIYVYAFCKYKSQNQKEECEIRRESKKVCKKILGKGKRLRHNCVGTQWVGKASEGRESCRIQYNENILKRGISLNDS